MGVAVKKRKTDVQRYHCTSCMVDRTADVFSDYNPTESCDHLINTCKRCRLLLTLWRLKKKKKSKRLTC